MFSPERMAGEEEEAERAHATASKASTKRAPRRFTNQTAIADRASPAVVAEMPEG